MPRVAISSPAESRQKWPVSLVICSTAPPKPMPTLDLVEALQVASEIRLQFLSVGFARWRVPFGEREAIEVDDFRTGGV
jgi:hypothetical protein